MEGGWKMGISVRVYFVELWENIWICMAYCIFA